MPRFAPGLILAVVGVVPAVAQPSPPLRSLVEELRIDGKAHEWTQVATVRVGPGAHILVGERRGTAVRVFSAEGRLVRSIGRRGQGPGEFEEIVTVGALGDTIWAGDTRLNRLTFFDIGGTVLGTTRVDSATHSSAELPQDRQPRSVWAPPRVLYPDGTALVAALTMLSPADTVGNVLLVPIWRTTRRGRILDTVLFSRRENLAIGIASADGQRRTMLSNPFPQREHFANSVDGRRFVLVSARFAGSDAWTYDVTVTDENRRPVYTRRFPFTRAPVPASTVDSIVKAMTARFAAYQGVREAIPVPPSYPPVSRVLVQIDGSVWLRGRDDPAGATWTILDPRGEPVASVREPGRTRFIDLDHGLWAIERDADDVESIVRYRVGAR